jgi:hypothetical protein
MDRRIEGWGVTEMLAMHQIRTFYFLTDAKEVNPDYIPAKIYFI